MKTVFLLMAQYDGKAVIPVEDVCKDYFQHLEPAAFVRKCATGEIRLPLVRAEKSQKAAKGVPITDLAIYIDTRIEAARKEAGQMAH